MASMVLTCETCGDGGVEVARGRARKRRPIEENRGPPPVDPREETIRPRGAATSHAFSGWLKAEEHSMQWNMLCISVTLETCGGGGVEVEGRVERTI